MHLRALALALVVCALPLAAEAQPAGKVYRIGFLGSVSAAANKNRLEAFRQGLRDLGYAEGRNILIDYRWAEGDYERLPGLARELVGRKQDLIVSTGGLPTVRALRAATKTVPIVFLTSDPIAEGIVLSLSRPGGNFTGLDTRLAQNWKPSASSFSERFSQKPLVWSFFGIRETRRLCPSETASRSPLRRWGCSFSF